mmetsp:Transcript_18599/g.46886  ORF Transcript_18599/g.46886 Transcript_18599/m.46886 type:complete len:205 (-) Transcript_18599:744-1358(-)
MLQRKSFNSFKASIFGSAIARWLRNAGAPDNNRSNSLCSTLSSEASVATCPSLPTSPRSFCDKSRLARMVLPRERPRRAPPAPTLLISHDERSSLWKAPKDFLFDKKAGPRLVMRLSARRISMLNGRATASESAIVCIAIAFTPFFRISNTFIAELWLLMMESTIATAPVSPHSLLDMSTFSTVLHDHRYSATAAAPYEEIRLL